LKMLAGGHVHLEQISHARNTSYAPRRRDCFLGQI
jgi:hypothetical protein